MVDGETLLTYDGRTLTKMFGMKGSDKYRCQDLIKAELERISRNTPEPAGGTSSAAPKGPKAVGRAPLAPTKFVLRRHLSWDPDPSWKPGVEHWTLATVEDVTGPAAALAVVYAAVAKMVGHWDVVSLAGGWRISGKGKGGAVERGEGVNNCKLFAFRSAPVPQPMQQSSPELARQAAGTPKETAPRNNQNLAKQGKKTFSLKASGRVGGGQVQKGNGTGNAKMPDFRTTPLEPAVAPALESAAHRDHQAPPARVPLYNPVSVNILGLAGQSRSSGLGAMSMGSDGRSYLSEPLSNNTALYMSPGGTGDGGGGGVQELHSEEAVMQQELGGSVPSLNDDHLAGGSSFMGPSDYRVEHEYGGGQAYLTRVQSAALASHNRTTSSKNRTIEAVRRVVGGGSSMDDEESEGEDASYVDISSLA